jgi:hypothetical protein
VVDVTENIWQICNFIGAMMFRFDVDFGYYWRGVVMNMQNENSKSQNQRQNRRIVTGAWPRDSFKKAVLSKIDCVLRFRREHPDLIVRKILGLRRIDDTIMLRVEVEDRE